MHWVVILLLVALLARSATAQTDLCNPNPCFTGQSCQLSSDGTSYTCYTPTQSCNSTDPNMDIFACTCQGAYFDVTYGQNSQLGVVNATCSLGCFHTGVITQGTGGSYSCVCDLYGNYYGSSCQYCTAAQNDTSCLQPTAAPTTLAPTTTPHPTTRAPTVTPTPTPTPSRIVSNSTLTNTTTPYTSGGTSTSLIPGLDPRATLALIIIVGFIVLVLLILVPVVIYKKCYSNKQQEYSLISA